MWAFWIRHLLSWNPSSCQQSIGGAIKLFATVISNFLLRCYCVYSLWRCLEHFVDETGILINMQASCFDNRGND